jgi:hypothetical protein
MRSIRFIEYPYKPNVITPFIGSQIDICKAFRFDAPPEALATDFSFTQPLKKRGRPAKKKSDESL